jgi:hypothetical protein
MGKSHAGERREEEDGMEVEGAVSHGWFYWRLTSKLEVLILLHITNLQKTPSQNEAFRSAAF